jgi:lysophospholipase L1-like esterase
VPGKPSFNNKLKQMSEQSSRRKFLQQASLAGVAAIGIPQLVSNVFAAEPSVSKIKVGKDDIILFQGDSITDSGRKKEESTANNAGAFGNGYAMIAGSQLLLKHADKNLKIYNKGISGNKVYQLAERWQKDCLDLKPTVLSILIGVNDYWHKHNGNYNGTIETYRNDLTKLLDDTKQKLPGVKFIIGEPFVVKGIKAVDDSWFPAFDEYRVAAREVAGKFGAAFIPYQTIYDRAQQKAPGVFWTHDGVHPSLAGAALMAEAWMNVVK